MPLCILTYLYSTHTQKYAAMVIDMYQYQQVTKCNTKTTTEMRKTMGYCGGWKCWWCLYSWEHFNSTCINIIVYHCVPLCCSYKCIALGMLMTFAVGANTHWCLQSWYTFLPCSTVGQFHVTWAREAELVELNYAPSYWGKWRHTLLAHTYLKWAHFS